MIILEDILLLHSDSLKKYGGGDGVRDIGLLESAIARPFQTFDGEDLYSTIIEKAAAIGESLIINHPFVDENKRTGFLQCLRCCLRREFCSQLLRKMHIILLFLFPPVN